MAHERFEFIPCTCPQAEENIHGHIFDNDRHENSDHVYNVDDGLKFMTSLNEEITEKNSVEVISQMKDFFNQSLITETEAGGTGYQ